MAPLRPFLPTLFLIARPYPYPRSLRSPLRSLRQPTPHGPLPRPPYLQSTNPYSTKPDTSPRHYTFEEIQNLSSKPKPGRVIIDVREPSELQQTGRIPGALSMPLTSNPDAFSLSDDDFFDRFGFDRPRPRSSSPSSTSSSSPFTPAMKQSESEAGLSADKPSEEGAKSGGGDGEGRGVDEVIFYCKAGVRSRAAARMAREWEGVRVGDWTGGWIEWEGRGGGSERG